MTINLIHWRRTKPIPSSRGLVTPLSDPADDPFPAIRKPSTRPVRRSQRTQGRQPADTRAEIRTLRLHSILVPRSPGQGSSPAASTTVTPSKPPMPRASRNNSERIENPQLQRTPIESLTAVRDKTHIKMPTRATRKSAVAAATSSNAAATPVRPSAGRLHRPSASPQKPARPAPKKTQPVSHKRKAPKGEFDLASEEDEVVEPPPKRRKDRMMKSAQPEAGSRSTRTVNSAASVSTEPTKTKTEGTALLKPAKPAKLPLGRVTKATVQTTRSSGPAARSTRSSKARSKQPTDSAEQSDEIVPKSPSPRPRSRGAQPQKSPSAIPETLEEEEVDPDEDLEPVHDDEPARTATKASSHFPHESIEQFEKDVTHADSDDEDTGRMTRSGHTQDNPFDIDDEISSAEEEEEEEVMTEDETATDIIPKQQVPAPSTQRVAGSAMEQTSRAKSSPSSGARSTEDSAWRLRGIADVKTTDKQVDRNPMSNKLDSPYVTSDLHAGKTKQPTRPAQVSSRVAEQTLPLSMVEISASGMQRIEQSKLSRALFKAQDAHSELDNDAEDQLESMLVAKQHHSPPAVRPSLPQKSTMDIAGPPLGSFKHSQGALPIQEPVIATVHASVNVRHRSTGLGHQGQKHREVSAEQQNRLAALEAAKVNSATLNGLVQQYQSRQHESPHAEGQALYGPYRPMRPTTLDVLPLQVGRTTITAHPVHHSEGGLDASGPALHRSDPTQCAMELLHHPKLQDSLSTQPPGAKPALHSHPSGHEEREDQSAAVESTMGDAIFQGPQASARATRDTEGLAEAPMLFGDQNAVELPRSHAKPSSTCMKRSSDGQQQSPRSSPPKRARFSDEVNMADDQTFPGLNGSASASARKTTDDPGVNALAEAILRHPIFATMIQSHAPDVSKQDYAPATKSSLSVGSSSQAKSAHTIANGTRPSTRKIEPSPKRRKRAQSGSSNAKELIKPIRFRPDDSDDSSSEGSSGADSLDGPTLLEEQEDEWSATLEPHQAALYQALEVTSRWTVQSLVKREAAITSALEAYEETSTDLVESFQRDLGAGLVAYQNVVKQAARQSKAELEKMSRSVGELIKEQRTVDGDVGGNALSAQIDQVKGLVEAMG